MLSRKDFQSLEDFIKNMKSVFPYVDDPYDDGKFTQVRIGLDDKRSFLVRISYEHSFYDPVEGSQKFKRISIGIFIIQDQKQHIIDCTFGFDELKKLIVDTFKKHQDLELEKRTNIMKANLDSMMLCGFLTQNSIEFSADKKANGISINIFGTIFDKLVITIDNNTPKTYTIANPLSKGLCLEQVKTFINTCKELNVKK